MHDGPFQVHQILPPASQLTATQSAPSGIQQTRPARNSFAGLLRNSTWVSQQIPTSHRGKAAGAWSWPLTSN
jgi:hypothetical protein